VRVTWPSALAATVLGLALTAATLTGACGGPAPTAPEEAPAPPPTPEPSPTPIYGCGLPRGTGLGRNCPRVGSTFHGEVEAAIQYVVDVYPFFFDFRRARGGPTSYRVRNPAGYNREVVERLRRQGFCALDDGKEIGVKTSNNFSDHFQILSSDLFVIRGLPSYRSTCFPAWDAIPPHGDE
jgi:hypothetical protein